MIVPEDSKIQDYRFLFPLANECEIEKEDQDENSESCVISNACFSISLKANIH